MADVSYTATPKRFRKRVFFEGSTALRKGQGLCYNADYGTAGDAEGRRNKYVELPSSSNAYEFAGVVCADHNANANGQWIDIFVPGSVCEIMLGADTTVNSTILGCIAGSGNCAGVFGPGGLVGKGAAKALQTVTALYGSGLDGAGSVSGTTLTDTDAFATAAVGDYVYILGGDGGTVTATRYAIASVTDDDNAVLDSAPGDGNVTWFGVSGNKTALAYLFTDEQDSGMTEYVSPEDNAAAQHMVGGTTFVCGGYTMATDDSTATLADGTRLGEHKYFKGLGTLTTKDYKVTVTTGIQSDGGTALASVAFNAADEVILLKWAGAWLEMYTSGATKA